MKLDRALFRNQMKKEYKKFCKSNKAYKNFPFADFVKLVKLNMLAGSLKQAEPTTNDLGMSEIISSLDEVTESSDENSIIK